MGLNKILCQKHLKTPEVSEDLRRSETLEVADVSCLHVSSPTLSPLHLQLQLQDFFVLLYISSITLVFTIWS